MRCSYLIFLPLTLVQAATLQRRAPQSPISNSSPKPPGVDPLAAFLGKIDQTANNGDVAATLIQTLPKAKLAKLDKLQPQVRKGAQRTIARYGPYHLVGKGVWLQLILIAWEF